MTFKKGFLALVCVCFSVVALLGQSTTATIQGLVMDQQRALIPGVMVTTMTVGFIRQ